MATRRPIIPFKNGLLNDLLLDQVQAAFRLDGRHGLERADLLGLAPLLEDALGVGIEQAARHRQLGLAGQ